MKNTNGPTRQNGQLRNGPTMRNGPVMRNGPMTATHLHFDDETAAYERKVAKDAISPRTKWYDITKQLVASSRDNSPNHHKLNSDYQWKDFNGRPNGHHLVAMNGNKNSVVSDDSECQTAKMTNSSQCSVVVVESVAPPSGHHHQGSSRADALIEAKTCSFEDSVPMASHLDESDKLSAVEENYCSRLIPNIENSILVDVSHLTDPQGYDHQRVPHSHPATPEHVFVPIETEDPCASYIPQQSGYERDRSRTQEAYFNSHVTKGNPHHHNHHQQGHHHRHHHHHHHHHNRKYKSRSRKLKMEKQLEVTTRRRKRKRQQRHRLWSGGGGGGGGAEGIEEERRRRQNHKMSHRRRASSVSVQKTRNVTKSMVGF